jgi:iron complex outermembrane receptor protein
MKSKLLLCTALAGMASVTTSALAQSNDTQAETVIVTGHRPPQDKVPMKATFTQSNISEEAILNASPSPASTIQTLLNTEPSIYATTGATNGMETDIKFRSFSDGEFGETVAGVPLNDIFNSGVTYQADNRNNALLITRDLESVDIYRGVYNSLGGTINFIPRQPLQDMGGDVGVDGGSFNTLEVHGTFDTGDLYGIRQTLSVERDTSSGWLQNTPDWNDNVYWAANTNLAANTELYSYFVFNKNEGNAPQFIPFNIMNQSGQDFQWPTNLYKSVNTDTNFLGIFGGKTQVSDAITLEDEGYIGDNNYQRTSFSNPAYPGPYFIDDQGSGYPFWTSYMGYDGYTKFPYNGAQAYGNSTSGCTPDCAYAGTDYHFYGYNGALYGDRVQATIDVPYNTFTLGGDWNVGELHSREYWYGAFNMPKFVGYNDAWDEHDTRQLFSAYAQDDVHLWNDRIHVTPGLRYDGSDVKDNDAVGFYYFPPGSIKTQEHFLSPTVGVSVEPITDFTLYGAYGKNVKFPDITALYSELGFGGTVPPATVKPEYAEDYELGARYKWENLQAEANVYQENFADIIYSFPIASGAAVQANGGGERFRGVELQLTDDFGEIYVGDWKGYLNASYNEAVCTTPTTNVLTGGGCQTGESLNNIPNYLMNVGVTWDYDGWHVDLLGHYVGRQALQDYNTGLPINPLDLQPGQPTEIPDYFLFNVGIAKVVPVALGPASAVKFALHVDNLFDKHYYSNAETNTDSLNTPPPNNPSGPPRVDFYGLTGEPRAVFGTVSVYF